MDQIGSNWIKLDQIGLNWFKVYQITSFVLDLKPNLKISCHGRDKHFLDKHGLDKHGLDKHGHDKHVRDKHVRDKHALDKHGLDKLLARSLGFISILLMINCVTRATHYTDHLKIVTKVGKPS